MSVSDYHSQDDRLVNGIGHVTLKNSDSHRADKPPSDAGPAGDKKSSQTPNRHQEDDLEKTRIEKAKDEVDPSPMDNEEEEEHPGDDDDSEEDSSSDEEVTAPIELLGEFVQCIRAADWENAAKLCKMILIYEPDNAEALQFQPLIEEKMKVEKELAEMSSSSESEEDDSTDEDSDQEDDPEEQNDGGDDSAEEFEDRPGSMMKNRLIFPHKDPVWKP